MATEILCILNRNNAEKTDNCKENIKYGNQLAQYNLFHYTWILFIHLIICMHTYIIKDKEDCFSINSFIFGVQIKTTPKHKRFERTILI